MIWRQWSARWSATPLATTKADGHVGDAAGGSDEAGADTAAEELDPLAPHAVRPAPPMMTAIIAAGIRHFPMPQSSIE